MKGGIGLRQKISAFDHVYKKNNIKERRVHSHTNSESCKLAKFNSDRKKSIFFQTNHSDITTNNHQQFFEAFACS